MNLKFWKKEEPFGESADDKLSLPELDSGYPAHKLDAMPELPQMPSLAPQHSFQQKEKDIELIEAKLDTIKALLENINQRLANLERIARE